MLWLINFYIIRSGGRYMAISDTRIHNIELLLTLDYLLKHTDENHPATQQEICKHAIKYGLKYDPKATKGNDVRRQRIGECLKFLSEICGKFPDDTPFILETTDSGKYYIDQRQGLHDLQVAKILAAIKNDRYTKDEDASFLIDKVLDACSTSEYNRAEIKRIYKELIRSVRKYDSETIRKINLIEKAYKESKSILVRHSVNDPKRHVIVDYDFLYRVYLVKEYNHELYALLIPVGQLNVNEKIGRLVFFNNYIFEPISKINIPNIEARQLLCTDEKNRDFNELFRKANPLLAKKYHTIDEMLEKTILPKGGKSCIVSFYFHLGLKDILRRSFENYFNEEFRYQETALIKGVESTIKDVVQGMDNWVIITDENKDLKPTHGLVNLYVDNKAFKSWLLSDPHGEGNFSIMDMITLIKPTSLHEEIANYYKKRLIKEINYLSENSKDELYDALIQNNKK